MSLFALISLFLTTVNFVQAQSVTDPLITSWVQSCGLAASGSAKGILTNVLKIGYDNNYVYIQSSGIPSYSIGTWASNPNSAANKNYFFQLARSPSAGTATIPSVKIATGMGAIGYLTNGVPIYNMEDGYSYKTSTGTFTTSGDGIWQRNAYIFEGISFDSCNGHPDASSAYHNHIDPKCLYTKNSTAHSPLIGWLKDGYPLYGPYGYTTNAASAIKRMQTGYAKRTDMAGVRNTTLSCSTGTCITTTLSSSQYGPDISTTYALGYLIQDWVWQNGSDLDIYNGRANSITPEYPNGVYAYYLPLDSSLAPTVPYIIGPKYYGTPQTSSITSIPSSATIYYTNSITSTCSTTSSSSGSSNNMNIKLKSSIITSLVYYACFKQSVIN